jgi:tetratricopeptide (TPR) repeat protein
LAAVDLELGQPERALAHLEQALYLNPGYEQAHFYQGLAYKALDQHAAAIEAFEQALDHAEDEEIRARILEYLDELNGTQGTRGGGPD